MSVKFDVNACLEAAMRANPNASRDFLTRALTQTLQGAGEDVTREQIDHNFDAVRALVGWKYMGSPMPLQQNAAARLNAPMRSEEQVPEPNVIVDYFTIGENGEPLRNEAGEEVEGGTSFGFYMSKIFAMSDIPVTGLSRVRLSEGQEMAEEEKSMTVRLKIDERGAVSVDEILEGEPDMKRKLNAALMHVGIPEKIRKEDGIGVGTIVVRIELEEKHAA